MTRTKSITIIILVSLYVAILYSNVLLFYDLGIGRFSFLMPMTEICIDAFITYCISFFFFVGNSAPTTSTTLIFLASLFIIDRTMIAIAFL